MRHQWCGCASRMRGTRSLAVCISGIVLTVGGCAVGPNFHRPQPSMPAGWHGPANSAPASQASVPVVEPLQIIQWWTTFNDPALDALVSQAAANNLDLLQAEARIRQARANRDIAVSPLFPTFSAVSSYSRSETGAKILAGNVGGTATSSSSKSNNTSAVASLLAKLLGTSTGTGTGTGTGTSSPSSVTAAARINAVPHSFFQAGFDSAWELDVFGGTRRNIESANATLQASVEDRRNVLITLLSEVAVNYIQLRGFQREIVIARENLVAQEKTADVTRRRFRGGFVSRLDVANADAQVATTKSTIPPLEVSARQSIYSLSVLLGREPAALLPQLSPDGPIPAAPPTVPVGLPSELLRRRPDIRFAEGQLHATTANIGVAVAQLFPQFTLNGSILTQGNTLEKLGDWGFHTWSFGPSMNWPIFQGGATIGNIRLQTAVQQQSMLQYQKTVLTALQDVENALVAFTEEQDRRTALEDAVNFNRQAVDVSMRLYTQGQTDFLNVLNAQRSLFAVEDALAQSERTVATNLVALYKALGGGWEVPLPPPVPVPTPQTQPSSAATTKPAATAPATQTAPATLPATVPAEP